MTLVKGKKTLTLSSFSGSGFLMFYMITPNENCGVHFLAVLVFLVWEDGGMGWLVLMIVG